METGTDATTDTKDTREPNDVIPAQGFPKNKQHKLDLQTNIIQFSNILRYIIL